MEQIKHILIVTESINVEDSSGTKGRVSLIQNLAAVGYNVKVLHYTRKNINLQGINCIEIPEIKNSVSYLLSRTQRVMQRLFKINISRTLENRFGFSFTFFNDSKGIARAVRKHYSGEDLIITLSKGASFRPHHAMLQLPQLHAKWMVYVHDPYPFHYYPPPYDWVEPGHLHKEDFFRKVSERAQFAAFPSLKLREWMQHFFPAFTDKSVIIPHQLSKEGENTSVLPKYFEASKFTVLHAGNLMKQRNPFPLLEAWEKFIKGNPKAVKESQLLLIGPASYHQPKLSEMIDGMTSIHLSERYVPYEIVKKMERTATVNIIMEAVSEKSPFLPGKFPLLIAAGKPILHLGPKDSETLRLLGEAYPWQAAADAVSKITEKLEELYGLWNEDKNKLQLDRPDLVQYLAAISLQRILDNLPTP